MQVVSHQEYDELFTMHGSTMVYLVVQPLALALGVYLVPLQIGAADLVAPRVALASAAGCIVAGGLVMYLGFLTTTAVPGPPAGRRSCRCPTPATRRARGMDMWVLGVLARQRCATAARRRRPGDDRCCRRAPGMTMLRLPVFCWTDLSPA